MIPEELKFVLAVGEGQKIEFKEAMSSLDKDLAAFATMSEKHERDDDIFIDPVAKGHLEGLEK